MKMIILGTLILLSSQLYAVTNQVCFYKDKNYEGGEWCISEDHTLVKENDVYSSIKVHGTAYAEVFKDRDYKGIYTIVMHDALQLKRLNDDISSVKIKFRDKSDYACLYQDADFVGTPMCAESGSSIDDMSIGDLKGEMSSAYLTSGAMAKLFEKTYFDGSNVEINMSENNLKNVNFNDKTDSFKVLPNDGSTLDKNHICFFDDKNYEKTRWCTDTLGKQNIPSYLNDKISSIRVRGKAYADVYVDANQSGQSTRVMHDAHHLLNINDKISSVNIKLRDQDNFACLYQDNGYTGTPACAEQDGELDNLDSADLGKGASSLYLHGIAKVTLYENKNFSGSSLELSRSSGNLKEHSFNDKANSMRVTAGTYDQLQLAMNAQNQISKHSPIYEATWLGTHNSFNSGDYYSPSAGTNQKKTIIEQLEAGVRHIEIDIRETEVRHKPDLLATGAHLAHVMSEIQGWLRANPEEFLYVKLEHGWDYDFTDKTQLRNIVARRLNEALGDLIYRDPTAGCSYIPKKTTTQELLQTGAQIMIFGYKGDCGEEPDYREIVWDRLHREPNHNDDFNNNCDSVHLPGFATGEITIVPEDKRGIFDQQVPHNQIRSALECGLNTIGRDQLDVDGDDGYIEKNLFTWRSGDYKAPGSDNEAVVFVVQQNQDGYYQIQDKQEAFHAICRTTDNTLELTKAVVTFDNAAARCREDYSDSSFSLPYNAYETGKFRKKHGGDSYWLNYQSVNGEWVPLSK